MTWTDNETWRRLAADVAADAWARERHATAAPHMQQPLYIVVVSASALAP